MPTSSTLMRTLRPAFRPQFRFTQSTRSTGFTFKSESAFRSKFGGRRYQSTAAPEAPKADVGFLKRMWDSPIGLKTVHFWAPVMKWGIVIAGISDFYRPAEKLSLTQNCALTATGLIWTRWCLIIKPRNILLATVNFFLGCVGVVQVSRILSYNYKQKGLSAGEQVKEAKEDVKEIGHEIKGKALDVVKS